MPSTLIIGPPVLGLTVTTASPLSSLTRDILSLYADAIASRLNSGDNESDIEALKVPLYTLPSHCQLIHFR